MFMDKGVSESFFMNEVQTVGSAVGDVLPTLRLLMKLMPGEYCRLQPGGDGRWGFG